MASKDALGLTKNEIAAAFAYPEIASRFPPILTEKQAADIVQVPEGTVRDWRSRGLLKGCWRKIGKHVRFFRDRFLLKIFNEGLTS